MDSTTHSALERILAENPDPTRKLRALWALHATGGLSERRLRKLLAHGSEHVRGWAVRLELEDGKASQVMLAKFSRMARSDSSSRVRLCLASGLQRLPLQQRWSIAAALVARAEDAGDQNLPLMIWYGVEPLIEADPDRALELVTQSRLPIIRRHVARRIASLSLEPATLGPLVQLLGQSHDPDLQLDVLRGIH